MPKTDDPIVYRYTGHDGESLTGIPGRSLRQSDVDAMDAEQKKLLKAHLAGEHRHIYSDAEAPAAAEKAPEPTASQNKLGTKAADQKKGDG